MTFRVFADGTANLPEQLREGIELLPSDYTVDGVEKTYVGDIDRFDVHAYYEGLRNGMEVHTSLLNTELFLSHFTPLLKQGMDIIYVAMSSGISGTYNAARIAGTESRPLCPYRGFPRLRLWQRHACHQGGTVKPGRRGCAHGSEDP